MSGWVQAHDGGLINLAHVVCIVPTHHGPRLWCIEAALHPDARSNGMETFVIATCLDDDEVDMQMERLARSLAATQMPEADLLDCLLHDHEGAEDDDEDDQLAMFDDDPSPYAGTNSEE